MTTSKRQLIWSAVRLLVSAGLIGFLLTRVNLSKLFDTIVQSRWEFFIILIFIDLIGYLARSLRWKYILSLWDIDIALITLFFYAQGGRLFNIILPSSIGGDAYRMYLSASNTNRRTQSVIAIILDRFCGVTMGFSLAAAGVILFEIQGLPFEHTRIVVLFIAGWTCFLLVLFSRRVAHFAKERFGRFNWFGKIDTFFASVRTAREHPRTTAKALAASVVVKLHEVLVTYCVAQALGLPVSFLFCLAVASLIGFITIAPVSISGIGIRESLYIYFFTRIGLTTTEAFSLSVTVFSWMALTGIAGGIMHLIWWNVTSARRADRSRQIKIIKNN